MPPRWPVLLNAMAANSLTLPSNTWHNAQTVPRFIVLASDHGTGSSTFSGFLSKHPCVVDINEPFSPFEMFASATGKSALFTFNGRFGELRALHKLEERISAGASKKGCQALSLKFLYNIKENTSLTKFFDKIYRHIAQCVRLPRECNGHMVLSHKMFPIYADNNIDYILAYLMSDDRAVVHLQRNEKDRQECNIRRNISNAKTWDGKNISDWDALLNGQEQHGSFSSHFFSHVHVEEDLWPTATSYKKVLKGVFDSFKFDRDDWLMQPVSNKVEQYYEKANVRESLQMDD